VSRGRLILAPLGTGPARHWQPAQPARIPPTCHCFPRTVVL